MEGAGLEFRKADFWVVAGSLVATGLLMAAAVWGGVFPAGPLWMSLLAGAIVLASLLPGRRDGEWRAALPGQLRLFAIYLALVAAMLLAAGFYFPGAEKAMSSLDGALVVRILVASVVTAIAEELLFRRALLLQLLLGRWQMRPVRAVLLAALVFQVCHLSFSPLLLLNALVLGTLVFWQRSILAAIGVHAVTDVLALAGTYLSDLAGYHDASHWETGVVFIGAASLAVLVFGVGVLFSIPAPARDQPRRES